MDYSLELGREVLQRTPDVVACLLSGLSDEWTQGREAPDAWSPYQVAGHLLYVEESDWIDRTQVILKHGTAREFEPVDREAGFTRYAGWSLTDLLERFAATRAANLAELQNLVGEDELERRGVHPAFGEVTLRQLLATWVVHDLNHLNQISKTMAKQYRDAIGPWRAFLPVVDAP